MVSVTNCTTVAVMCDSVHVCVCVCVCGGGGGGGGEGVIATTLVLLRVSMHVYS